MNEENKNVQVSDNNDTQKIEEINLSEYLDEVFAFSY